MKRTIALLVVLAFMASIASVVFARTLEEERDAVRAYLKVVDAKIIKFRKAGNTKKMKLMQAEKQGTLRRWYKLKAQLEAAPPPPPVAPVPPPPPPTPVVVAPAAPAGLFGMGINASLSGMYINTGKGQISGAAGARGDWVLDDFLGLGSMVGLSADAIKYKLGLGAVYGGGEGMRGIPVFADGVINLPADMMGGLESYLTGGFNYVVYGNQKTSGRIGGEIAYGILADLGLGLGKTGFELGWSAVRSTNHTVKGIMLSVSQPLVL